MVAIFSKGVDECPLPPAKRSHDLHNKKFYFSFQTGGSALLDVLTGVVSPAGRLPNTWPASLDQVFSYDIFFFLVVT